jgi:hypothetical protein
VPFDMLQGAEVRIRLSSPASGARAALLELLPGGIRLPSPEYLLPRPPPAAN